MKPTWVSPCESATLYLGDCLEILPTLAAGSVDAVVTDPPYTLCASSTRRGTRVNSPLGDWVNAARWFGEWYGEVWRILLDAGCFWTCAGWRTIPVLELAAAQNVMAAASVVVWDKCWIGVGSMKGLRQRYELVLQYGKPAFAIPDRSIPDIWPLPWSSQRPSGHPSQKPVALPKRCIEVSALQECATVVDPFMGSGTTGVACIETNYKYIGIEIEPVYFEIAKRRIERVIDDRDGGLRGPQIPVKQERQESLGFEDGEHAMHDEGNRR